MKNYKKILMLFAILGVTLLLTSCGKKPDTTHQFYFHDVDSEQLVVDSFDEKNSIETLKIYEVQAAGQVVQIDIGRGEASEVKYLNELDEEVSHTEAIKKEYEFTFGIPVNKYHVTQYLKNDDLDVSSMYLDFISFDTKGNVNRSGAVLTSSYLFEGQNIEYYEIGTKGVRAIDLEDITIIGYPTEDELIQNRKFINNENFNLKVEYDGADVPFEFQIRLSAIAKPIHPKTATFWNWISLKMPIAYVMSFFGKITGKSFALAILLTTILVRTLAWPIYAKTNDMSLKMQLAQPDLDKLQRKYATRKDPESQQKMQLEMMAIYRKHKINFLGCLLPILQMPIFIGMYQVVNEITIPGGKFYQDVLNTNFFLTDLAGGGTIAKLIFTALVGLTMWGLQKISQIKPSYAKNVPPTNKNPQAAQQEQTMKMVSIMMIFMMMMTSYFAPGLALSYYWIIGNIYSLGQNLFNKYISENKYKKLEEERLYGRSREIIDAKFKEKGDK